MQEDLSEPEFYGYLVYKFRKTVGKTDLSEQFKNILTHYKMTCCNMDTLLQTARIILNRANTQRPNNVVTTSLQRHDVATTL